MLIYLDETVTDKIKFSYNLHSSEYVFEQFTEEFTDIDKACEWLKEEYQKARIRRERE